MDKIIKQVRAYQIGNIVRVINNNQIGTIEDVAIIDGIFKYHVVSDINKDWDGWFTGFEINYY